MRTKPSSVSAKEISAYVRTLVQTMCNTFKRNFQQFCGAGGLPMKTNTRLQKCWGARPRSLVSMNGRDFCHNHKYNFVVNAISLSTTNCAIQREMFLQSLRVPILEENPPRIWKCLWRIWHVSRNYTHVAMMRKNAHISFSEARTHFSLSSNLPRHLTVT